MDKAVCVKNVYFAYDGLPVLENVSLDIHHGDYMGIVGPNGSGKSTLIKLMLGILRPLKGDIEIFGRDIKAFRDWGKIGYVAQRAAFFDAGFPATVEEVVRANLFSQIGLFRPVKKEHVEKVRQALEVVGMYHLRRKLVGNLSGGQQQKIFIARALVSSPGIIFLDEPTVGIDLKSQEEFYELLNHLNRDMGITIVIISHDIGVITERAGRIACVGDGKVMLHDSGADTSFNGLLRELYGDGMKILAHRH